MLQMSVSLLHLSTAYEGAQTLHIHVLLMCDAEWECLQPQQ